MTVLPRVDSSELAFKLAARKAFKAAMLEAKPALLEPIMNAEIQAPVEYAGDLMGDLNSRRGRIAGMDTKGATQFIRAQVPMSEMLNYQSDLTAMTQGRAESPRSSTITITFRSCRRDKVTRAARQPRWAKRKKRSVGICAAPWTSDTHTGLLPDIGGCFL
jgi:elongation factor G